MSELKNCPFCGGLAAIAAEGEFGQWPIVFCGNCNAQTGVELAESEAISAWNTRTSPLASLSDDEWGDLFSTMQYVEYDIELMGKAARAWLDARADGDKMTPVGGME